MQKKLLFLILSLISFCNSSFATHFYGNELSYEHLGGCTYRIHQTFYYECSGCYTSTTTPPAIPLNFINMMQPAPLNFIGVGGCNVNNIPTNWKLEYYKDASGICWGGATNCTGGNTAGAVQVSYYTDISLCNLSCSQVKIYWENCCRSYSMTTGLASSSLYNEIIIPLANTPNNSSPQFISPPFFYTFQGQTLTIPQTAFDKDGDSLVYSIAPVLTSGGGFATYSPGYSGTSPLGAYYNVSINPNTGLLTIASTSGSQVISAIRIKVDEYRNNLFIGSVSRDAMLLVVPSMVLATNNLPSITLANITGAGLDTTSHTLTGSANYPIEFDVIVADADINQHVGIVANLQEQFPNASLTLINGTNPATYHFSWTPQLNNMGETRPLWIDAADNNCLLTPHSRIHYNIHINTIEISANITNTACNAGLGAVDLTVSGGFPPFSFSWSNGATAEDINNLPMGPYQVLITEANGATWFSDTFYVNSSGMNVNIVQTPPACGTNTGALAAYPTGGTPPYTCHWNNGQVADSITNLYAGGYSVNITDIYNCFLHEVSVLNTSTTCYGTISGRLFNDLNQNCVQDSGEYGVENQIIRLQNPQIATLTNSLGEYSFTVANTGNYVVEYMPSPYTQNIMSNVCIPAPYVQNAYITALGTNLTNVNFPITFGQDIAVYLSENLYRPNISHSTYIHCNNYTSPIDSALLTYKYDNMLHNVSAYPPALSLDSTAKTVIWHLSNFTNGMTQTFSLLGMTSALANIGDTATSYASLLPISGDYVPSNNVDTIYKRVQGAYDPNFKEVSPQGETAVGFIPPTTSQLTYTIHFQNTGNYPASFVTVRDTIDTNAFEIYSLEMQMSSHPCTVTIENEEVIVFSFENINLPDSTSDEPNSHGFVKFGLNLKPNLPLNAEITNQAAIYFDFNAPIITNSTLNTLHIAPQDTTINDTTNTTSANANAFFEHKVKVYPNPFSEITTFAFPNAENEDYFLIIRDLTGKVVQKIEHIHTSEVKILKENKAKGVYLWELKGKFLARGMLMLE